MRSTDDKKYVSASAVDYHWFVVTPNSVGRGRSSSVCVPKRPASALSDDYDRWRSRRQHEMDASLTADLTAGGHVIAVDAGGEQRVVRFSLESGQLADTCSVGSSLSINAEYFDLTVVAPFSKLLTNGVYPCRVVKVRIKRP